MLGTKINKFDNSDGTIKTFNKIFPKTPLKDKGNVEILDIVDRKLLSEQSVYVRNIDVNSVIKKHDFGENNFHNNKDFLVANNVRFKYFAKDLDGNTLAVAYNCDDLAKELGCNVNVIKRRLINKVNEDSNTEHLFNISRREV